MTRVTGLDLSLTSTGWATATVPTPGPPRPGGNGGAATIITTGRLTSKAPPKHLAQRPDVRSARLRRLAGDVYTQAAGSDLVVVEAPAFSSNTGHAHDRSGLWWLVVARLTGQGTPVAEVSIQHLKMFATGKGTADKDTVLLAAARTWPALQVQGNDDADALWLCALGARHLGHPIDPWPSVPLDRARALEKVQWPSTEGK